MSCSKTVKKETTDESVVEPPTHAFLDVKVYLQAAMSGTLTDMSTGLTGVIPTTDPYGVGVTCADINTLPDVVDWIKVELWRAEIPKEKLYSFSALLLKDGKIVDVDGKSPLKHPEEGNYHVVVKHRNHMAVMSDVVSLKIGSTTSVDFTQSATAAIGGNSPLYHLTNGFYGMHYGEFNHDCDISNADGQAAWDAITDHGFTPGYFNDDFNMDKVVNVNDTYVYSSNDPDYKASLFAWPAGSCTPYE